MNIGHGYTCQDGTVRSDGRIVAHIMRDPVNGIQSLAWHDVADYDARVLDLLSPDDGEGNTPEDFDSESYAPFALPDPTDDAIDIAQRINTPPTSTQQKETSA